jgi:hypothetical protein
MTVRVVPAASLDERLRTVGAGTRTESTAALVALPVVDGPAARTDREATRRCARAARIAACGSAGLTAPRAARASGGGLPGAGGPIAGRSAPVPARTAAASAGRASRPGRRPGAPEAQSRELPVWFMSNPPKERRC